MNVPPPVNAHTRPSVHAVGITAATGGKFSDPEPTEKPTAAKMSCRKRCKREILKFAGYLFRFITGTLNADNSDNFS
ncbi:Kv channel-interacting protein 4 isoform X3 [Clarias magur]|uniref:Kv channel-interacting protein 4 isoform X3 n=1 Tax=Clarias magur TaxID=1594786 RepID=A0A8J4U629_CLAMG|nr:Kv channel-interacting protein 4 isoform X3 [Clarias magur]